MIRWDERDGIATIAINRGGAGNALSHDGWFQLAAAASEIAAYDASVVILRSAHATLFSAGADLKHLARLHDYPELRAPFRDAMRTGIDAIAALPMPVIAAVDGGCFGAAVALVLACDICVAGDAAVFATTPAKLGIGYPGADVARLIARIGRGQAARMLFTAATVDADEAARIGLAEIRVTDAGATATAIAAQVAANAPGALRLLKRTLADPAHAAVDAEFDAAFGDAAFADRLAAFRQRPR